ncbi:MAG: acyl-CoA/acyl-ACP dehydrogenase [Chloroflexi bacterium]|nr:acyl-CoA/acyl-ACP dehydrogenase [Chloroflexota bacterium]
MSDEASEEHQAIRTAVRELCRDFPDAYWRQLDEAGAYPEAFVRTLSDAGWLAALIPEAYGGAGLGIAEASIVLEEIHRSGGNAAACHAQMYIMGTLLRHGSEAQKQGYLPPIAAGELRLQAFGVTEPNAGSETTRIQTFAARRGDRFVVNGQKIWTSRAQHSDLLLLLARTTPYDELSDKTRGLSVFIVDLRAAVASGQITIRPIRTMMNHNTTELFIQDLEVPRDNLIGEEGMGFRYIIDGWNAERVLIAAECIGDGHWFLERAVSYARSRVVFGRPIGSNQGVQFPLAQSHMAVAAADLMRWRAAGLFDAGKACGAEANMAKYLAAEASWGAANACLDAHGGFGFAAEGDVERKFRETRLYRTAPISQNLVLAFVGQHVLGLPRSYG